MDASLGLLAGRDTQRVSQREIAFRNLRCACEGGFQRRCIGSAGPKVARGLWTRPTVMSASGPNQPWLDAFDFGKIPRQEQELLLVSATFVDVSQHVLTLDYGAEYRGFR